MYYMYLVDLVFILTASCLAEENDGLSKVTVGLRNALQNRICRHGLQILMFLLLKHLEHGFAGILPCMDWQAMLSLR